MATGDSIEMQRMQEEALKRAREMYERAQNAEYNQNREEEPEEPPRQTEPSRPRNHSSQNQNHRPTQVTQKNNQANPSNVPNSPANPIENLFAGVSPGTGGALDTLFKDNDKTLIMILLVLLSSEGNNEILFALMYLMM